MPERVAGIGQRVAHARRLLGVTKMTDINPTDLARMVKVPPSTITRVENGERAPGEKLVEKLANVLNVSPAWLRYGTVDGGPSLPQAMYYGTRLEPSKGRKKG